MPRCKRWVKKGLVASRLLSLGRRLLGERVVILRYHSVQDAPEEDSPIGRRIVHRADDFAEQMAWLARNYEPVTLDEVASAIEWGRPLPSRGVLVTFDDGYHDNCAVAAPILNRLGIKAAFYITVDCIDRQQLPWFCRLRRAFAIAPTEAWQEPGGNVWPLADEAARSRAFSAASSRYVRMPGTSRDAFLDEVERALGVPSFAPAGRQMMTWDEVRELHGQGHTIGSHTMTHPNLALVSPDELNHELWESKRRLEEELGAPVRHFSYPSPRLQPHWNAETVRCCREAGYLTAVTTDPGPVLADNSLLSLTRFPVPETAEAFKWTVQCAFLGRYA